MAGSQCRRIVRALWLRLREQWWVVGGTDLLAQAQQSRSGFVGSGMQSSCSLFARYSMGHEAGRHFSDAARVGSERQASAFADAKGLGSGGEGAACSYFSENLSTTMHGKRGCGHIWG